MRSIHFNVLLFLVLSAVIISEQKFVPQIGGSIFGRLKENLKDQKVRDYDNKLPRRRSWSRGLDGTSWPSSARLVAEHEFPFVANLVNSRGETFVGTIVLESMILTPASKVKDAAPIQVIVGNAILTKKDLLKQETSDMVIHEKYTPGNFVNDIALLQLKKPLKFDEHTKPVRLPSRMERFAGERLFIHQPAEDLGWGTSEHLRSVDVTVLPNLNCTEGRGEEIAKELICTSVDTVYKDGPCSSESGAPLLLLELDEKHTMIGMLLNSECPVHEPPVHLRLTDYIFWIEHHGGPKTRFC